MTFPHPGAAGDLAEHSWVPGTHLNRCRAHMIPADPWEGARRLQRALPGWSPWGGLPCWWLRCCPPREPGVAPCWTAGAGRGPHALRTPGRGGGGAVMGGGHSRRGGQPRSRQGQVPAAVLRPRGKKHAGQFRSVSFYLKKSFGVWREQAHLPWLPGGHRLQRAARGKHQGAKGSRGAGRSPPAPVGGAHSGWAGRRGQLCTGRRVVSSGPMGSGEVATMAAHSVTPPRQTAEARRGLSREAGVGGPGRWPAGPGVGVQDLQVLPPGS